MPPNLPRISLAGALSSLGISACCILPTLLILFGVGGSWIAVFAKLAAFGYYVAAAASLILIGAWTAAFQGGTLRRNGRILGFGTGLSAIAWLVLLNETQLNDYLIGIM